MPGPVEADAALVDRLRILPLAERQALYDAAGEAVASARALADRDMNPVTAVLQGASTVNEWAHFPAQDVVDPKTHSRFYYHAHAAGERAQGEHGHFHTFIQPAVVAPTIRPIVSPKNAADENAWLAHLIGISTDASGRVIRLFTTNQWVTGEAFYDAASVGEMLSHFDMTCDAPCVVLNRWISAVVRMFRPQIVDLLHARDAHIAEFRATHPNSDVFIDCDLQITSETFIDVIGQIRAIEAALAEGR